MTHTKADLGRVGFVPTACFPCSSTVQMIYLDNREPQQLYPLQRKGNFLEVHAAPRALHSLPRTFAPPTRAPHPASCTFAVYRLHLAPLTRAPHPDAGTQERVIKDTGSGVTYLMASIPVQYSLVSPFRRTRTLPENIAESVTNTVSPSRNVVHCPASSPCASALLKASASCCTA